VLVAADTRASLGYSILSREHSKTTRLTAKCVITSSGMIADIEALHKNLLMRVKVYKQQFKREPDSESLAQLLGNTLYSRRFMPFYAFNLLCGLTREGEGVVYGYDAIGSWDSMTYGVQGSGSQLGAPVLDNQFVGHNYMVKKVATDIQHAEDTAKDIISSIAERDIYTGDGIEIVIVSLKDGITVKKAPCRRD
jgi:20S proteasome subunit beta 6